jgi:hypothetical protein
MRYLLWVPPTEEDQVSKKNKTTPNPTKEANAKTWLIAAMILDKGCFSLATKTKLDEMKMAHLIDDAEVLDAVEAGVKWHIEQDRYSEEMAQLEENFSRDFERILRAKLGQAFMTAKAKKVMATWS